MQHARGRARRTPTPSQRLGMALQQPEPHTPPPWAALSRCSSCSSTAGAGCDGWGGKVAGMVSAGCIAIGWRSSLLLQSTHAAGAPCAGVSRRCTSCCAPAKPQPHRDCRERLPPADARAPRARDVALHQLRRAAEAVHQRALRVGLLCAHSLHHVGSHPAYVGRAQVVAGGRPQQPAHVGERVRDCCLGVHRRLPASGGGAREVAVAESGCCAVAGSGGGACVPAGRRRSRGRGRRGGRRRRWRRGGRDAGGRRQRLHGQQEGGATVAAQPLALTGAQLEDKAAAGPEEGVQETGVPVLAPLQVCCADSQHDHLCCPAQQLCCTVAAPAHALPYPGSPKRARDRHRHHHTVHARAKAVGHARPLCAVLKGGGPHPAAGVPRQVGIGAPPEWGQGVAPRQGHDKMINRSHAIACCATVIHRHVAPGSPTHALSVPRPAWHSSNQPAHPAGSASASALPLGSGAADLQ